MPSAVIRIGLLTCGLVAIASCRTSAVRVPTVLGLDLFFQIPDDSPITRARVSLGNRLFFDPTLSADRTTSCATCHQPAYAFSDTVAMSRGAHGRVGRRNAPSLLNAAYRGSFFWDGRVSSLEVQVLLPIQDTLEMRLPLAELERRLKASESYGRQFRRAFGAEPSAANVALALASYLRTLRSGDAAADRFRLGDSASLPLLARRGLELFVGKARCSACHLGPLFSDGEFHNTGVASLRGVSADSGRAEVTGNPSDLGRFKTPSLRDVALTAPYMHNGSFATLEEVVDFYDRGARPGADLDELIRPIRLSADERRALISFLRSLTGSHVDPDS